MLQPIVEKLRDPKCRTIVLRIDRVFRERNFDYSRFAAELKASQSVTTLQLEIRDMNGSEALTLCKGLAKNQIISSVNFSNQSGACNTVGGWYVRAGKLLLSGRSRLYRRLN